MWKFLGAVLCGLSAVLVLSFVAVPIQAWPQAAPFEAYLRPVTAWMPCIFLVFAAGLVLAEPRYLTGPFARALAVLGIVAAFCWPAYALAQDAAPSTVISAGDLFRDMRSTIETLIGVIVAGVLALIANLVRRNLGLSIDDRMRGALQSALMNGVHMGLDAVQGAADTAKIDVKSRIVAEGIQYVRQYAPAAVKHFKLGEDDLAKMLQAKLAELQPAESKAVAQATGA